jgi:hypothetical protein
MKARLVGGNHQSLPLTNCDTVCGWLSESSLRQKVRLTGEREWLRLKAANLQTCNSKMITDLPN